MSTEVRADAFNQNPGAFDWGDSANHPESWRSQNPVVGFPAAEIIDVERELNSSYFLTDGGKIYGSTRYALPELLRQNVLGIIDIEAGFNDLFALTNTGEVWKLGQPFGNSQTTSPMSLEPVRIPLPPVKQLAVEGSEFFAVSVGGGLYERDLLNGATYDLVQNDVKSVAPNTNSDSAIIRTDGSVYEMDGSFRLIPAAPYQPLAIQGLPLTIVSLSYSVGLFAALDVSGDVYVWPQASYPDRNVAPQATKLSGVSGVVEMQLNGAGTSAPLPDGGRTNDLYFTIRTQDRHLRTGKLIGVTPLSSGTSRLILPPDLDFVEHSGLWDGFDYSSRLLAFSKTSLTPDEEPCWQNVDITDPQVQVCGVQIIRDG